MLTRTKQALLNGLKLAPQIGARVRTASITGIAEVVTDEHVLVRTLGWNNTCVWVSRNQLKGIYK